MKKETKDFFLSGKVVSLSVGVLPILAIIAYFSGWLYVNEYFSEFGINRSTFNFSDYTIFLNLFSVISNIPNMLNTFNWEIIKTILIILLSIIGVHFLEMLSDSVPKLFFIKIWVWLCLFIAFSFVSKEAGRIDAHEVLNRKARCVNIYLAESFKKDLIAFRGKDYAEQRVDDIIRDAEVGALSLLWRNTNETIILRFGTTGDFHNEPIEIIRINNKYIISVFTKVKEKKVPTRKIIRRAQS